MGTMIYNAVQNLGVMKKDIEKPNKSNSEKQQISDNISQANRRETAKDTIVFQISSQGIRPETHEIRDAQEAQQLLTDVISEISEINSENGKSPVNRIHSLNPGSVIDLLA